MRSVAFAVARHFRFAARIVALGALALASASCSGKQDANQWTLWYVPNQPKPGEKIIQTCQTYVFATAPIPVQYTVATVKGWSGDKKPQGNTALMFSGDSFTGSLDLGPQTVHDESNGYDVNVEVVYKIGTYLAAKARADADCPVAERR